MSAQSSFFNQIVSCTFSESEYERNSTSVLAQVTRNSRSKAKEFLDTIYEILTVLEYFPMQKFYALSLLVKATQSHNTILMDQIAGSKSFLNKLFKDAQTDKYRPIEERGRNFFSPNPTEEEGDFGNKYMILLLGAFESWDREFGTNDEKDPYHCYRAIQSALTDNINRSFVSSGSRKRSQSPEEFKLKAQKVSSREDEIEMKASETKTETEAFKQLKLCIPSMDDYDANSPLVFDKVEKQLAHYNRNLLSAVNSVLSRTEYTSKEKFFALYLIVKLTETNNKAFINQLANEAKLLNKIYALGKIAITNTSPRQRSDDIYQDNLNILLLEAAKYWHYAYGSSEPNSTYFSFTHLYQSLKEKGTFPKEYKYIKAIKEEPERRRERLSSSPVERNKREFVEDSGDPISRLIKAYIASGSIFREDYANISCILIKQPAVRSQNYLEETLKIVKSGKTTPIELFYAVYLLAKTTESKNSKLITALVECNELVEALFQDAQTGSNLPPELRGRDFFSKDPNLREATIGCNYVQLVLEMFNFWGKAYGTDDARNPKYVFKTLRNTLEKRTRFVDREYYVGRNLEDIDEEVMEGFETIPFYELPKEINKKKKELNEIANSLVREKTGNREGYEQEFKLKDLDKKLEMLTYSKIILTQFLGTNRKADVDEELLSELVNKVVTNYKNDVFPYLEYLLQSREQERERYTKKVYEEGRIAEKLEKEYMHFSLGRISYLELRKRIIATLTAQSSSNDSKEDLMEKLHQSMTQSEMVDAPRETRGSRVSSKNSRKASNSRGTRGSPEMEILEDENENGSEDERPTRGRASVNTSTWSGNRDQSQRLNSRSRDQSQESKKSKTFSPSRSTTPIRDSMRKSVRDESILSERESTQAFQEMKTKLDQIRVENQQLNRQNRVLQNEKLEALQNHMKQGNDDAGEIQDLKMLVEASRKKMEEIEREVQIINARKRREEEMRRAEEVRKAKEVAEAEERRKAAEELAEKEKAEKKMVLMTGKDLSKFIAQRKMSVDSVQDKTKEIFGEKKADSNMVVEPKRDVQQNQNAGQGSILDSFLTGNNRAY